MVKIWAWPIWSWTLNLTVSQDWVDGINWFFAVWYKFMQIKWKFENFWDGHGQKWVWPVWWCDYKSWLYFRCFESTDVINWFFAYWYRFTKMKSWSKFFCLCMVKYGCDHGTGHETLKLTVSQKWTDGINWFFACWYKFRKAICWFNKFCIVMVKNGHDHLVQETLKSAVS